MTRGARPHLNLIGQFGMNALQRGQRIRRTGHGSPYNEVVSAAGDGVRRCYDSTLIAGIVSRKADTRSCGASMAEQTTPSRPQSAARAARRNTRSAADSV